MSRKMLNTLDAYFGCTARGSSLRIEVMAGLTTFFAMAYILMVNASMFADAGVSYNAIYIATAISAVIGTASVGLLANLPLAQASGMGLNAYFVYTCCLGLGMTYANTLVLVLFDGVLFILLTVTGLRRRILLAIPDTVRTAIPAGIGLFIAFLGLQNAGVVIADPSTGVALASFNLLRDSSWSSIMPSAVTIAALFGIAILSHRGIRGAVLIGVTGSAVLYYLLGISTVPGFSADLSLANPLTAFGDFTFHSLGKVFTEGFDFSAFIARNGTVNAFLTIATTTLAFCMVDMFDTIGTLYGACARGKLLTPEGDIPNTNRAMLADAIATTAGAICGTSTVTTFVESTAGIAVGGRTGLTSLVTAALFFAAMFLSPVAQLIPACTTAAALIHVGILMMSDVKYISWDDATEAIPAFLTMTMMPFTCNISYGLCFGLISFIAIKAGTGQAFKIRPGTWVIAALFLAMLLLTH